MVPMWMFPIAITLGNAFILKPSEKVPLTACRLAELMLEAGYAPGLFSVLQGGRGAVEALIDHPQVRAVGFVGSTAAARAVHGRATALGKRALCLGRRQEPPDRRAGCQRGADGEIDRRFIHRLRGTTLHGRQCDGRRR